MATGDDTLMRDRVRPPESRPKGGILSLLDAETAKPAEPGGWPPASPDAAAEGVGTPGGATDPLPGPEDDYRAFARPVRQEVGIAFLSAAVPYDGFGYFDLRRVRLLHPDQPGGGPVLVLRFVEAEMTEVVLEGRNLLGLVDHLRQHRIAWIRELPRGVTVADPAAVVVTKISYRVPVLKK